MDTFTALAEPTRRSILETLAYEGELSATDISNKFRASPPAISQHLKVLRETNLVVMEKQAQRRLYQINPEPIYELEDWTKKLAQSWEERFQALDKMLEIQKRKSNPAQAQAGKRR